MSILLDGDRVSGQEVRNQNVLAAVAIANVVKSSLGPIGLDKMLVDDIGDVTITNDGATILSLLDVEHPAAKVLCELAVLQDQEVGDGTTSVIIAAELLKTANEMAKNGLHPTTIINGFRVACKEACRFINDKLAVKSSKLSNTYLLSIVKTTISSKVIGSESDFFCKLIVDAANSVKKTVYNKIKCPINSINVLKSHGGRMTDSVLVHGYALNCVVAAEGMPKRIHHAKIAFIEFNLQKMKMGLGVQVLVTDPEKLEAIRENETQLVMNRIKMILLSGANVVFCSGGIDDLCMKPFVESKVMAVRRVKKSDLRRIAEYTGGTVCMNLTNMEGDESFDSSLLGYADEVIQQRISDNELILINGVKQKTGASIILRGANDYMCEEMERSVHDALCAVKRVIESDSVVAGGGAVEAAVSLHLENFASSMVTREQLAVAEFANSLLVIPRTLALNSAFDATDLVAQLRSKHYSSQTDKSIDDNYWYGLDLINGKIINNLTSGVLEPKISKVKMLKFATEAAITIMRIDDMVKLNPSREAPSNDQCH